MTPIVNKLARRDYPNRCKDSVPDSNRELQDKAVLTWSKTVMILRGRDRKSLLNSVICGEVIALYPNNEKSFRKQAVILAISRDVFFRF